MSGPGRPSAWLVALAFFSLYVFWGGTYLAIRVAVETLPPFLMAGSRFVLAGAVLYAAMRARGAPRPEPVHWRSATIIGAALLLGGNGGVVWAEKVVPSGLAALLVSSVPLWIALFQWLGPSRLKPGAWGAVGLVGGFAGVALLALPGGEGAGRVDPAGAAALTAASISWALGSLYARGAPKPAAPLLAIAMQMICGGALQLLAGAALGELPALDLPAVPARGWLAMGYLVVFGSFGGFVSYVWLLGVRPAAQVATYAYVNPVIAVLLGWAVLGEPLTAPMIAAAVLVVASVAAITAAQGARR